MFEAIKNGDDDALRTVYAQYREPFIQWIGRRRGISAADAEDIFQNAVIVVYDNITSGKVTELSCVIKTYLYSIGDKMACNFLRKHTRSNGELSDYLVEHIVEESEVDDKVRFEEQLRIMYDGLDVLGNPCKKILQEHYFDKKRMSEIAERNGYKNADSAKAQKHKCMKRLQALIRRKLQNTLA